MSIHKPKIAKLPQNPGVYIFKDNLGKIIYVGKATNLKSRVGSYFALTPEPSSALRAPSPLIGRRGNERPIEALIHQVADIAVQETESVLEALILEANLIKKYQPEYNVMGKDDKSFSYFVITKEEFPRVLIVRETELHPHPSAAADTFSLKREKGVKVKKTFGPYTSKRQMEVALKIIRRIFPFHALAAKTEKGCLDFQLGRCPGPYAGAISKQDYAKNIRGIELILEGKKKSLVQKLKKEMAALAKEQKFEKAQEVKNKIFALNHVQDVALMTGESVETHCNASLRANLRIEAYDISNISGQHAVGSMVVFKNDHADKSQYRKFKIKTIEGADDVGAMQEVLLRRFKNDWAQPGLILLDGGKGHLNMAQKLLQDLGLVIPTVAVAKGPTRKKLDLYLGHLPAGRQDYELSKEVNNVLSNQNLLARIMGEAHRFAIGYHRKLRRKSLLK
ncbi:MAG: GIY-YIG nuclease family protein [Parcubacteria group bacterium]|jgi:excinuclease ABC subunit C